MNTDKNEDGTFKDPFMEASFQAYRNSETGKDALAALAFVSGVGEQEALHNIASHAPEDVVRVGLASALYLMFNNGLDEQAMTVIEDMAYNDLHREF